MRSDSAMVPQFDRTEICRHVRNRMKCTPENARKVRSSTFRNSRSAVEIQLSTTFELQRDSLVFKIVNIIELELLPIVFCKPGLGIKVAVMVSCDDNLLAVRKRG